MALDREFEGIPEPELTPEESQFTAAAAIHWAKLSEEHERILQKWLARHIANPDSDPTEEAQKYLAKLDPGLLLIARGEAQGLGEWAEEGNHYADPPPPILPPPGSI